MPKISKMLATTLAVAAVGLTGCTVSDSPSTTSTSSLPAAQGSGSGAGGTGDVKVAMVVHGGAGDAFWSDVKSGGEDAAAQTGVQLSYQTSDDLKQQADLITAAVAQGVKELIVSIPTVEALRAPIKAAQNAGISVIVINSGATDWQKLGAVSFIGQDESLAGQAAGQAMKQAGVTSMLCVNVTQVIRAVDQRCESATAAFGGPTKTVRIDPADNAAGTAQITATLQADPSINGVLSLGAGVYPQSAAGIRQAGSSAKLGTFDVTNDIITAVKSGSAAFAIDQQPYIQGYQAVVTAALLAKKNLLIGGGTAPIASGPRVLTRDTLR